MNKHSYEDFLKLMQQAIDSYHDDDDPIDEVEMIPEKEYEHEPPKFIPNERGMIDLTKFKKDKIQEQLFKCTNLKVGKFTVIIKKYYGMPTEDKSNVTVDISIMELKLKTITGNPCKMDLTINISKDKRFKDCGFLQYFTGNSYGNNVPVIIVVDLIRWLQAITKLMAFF
jgi:hypothetical protein